MKRQLPEVAAEKDALDRIIWNAFIFERYFVDPLVPNYYLMLWTSQLSLACFKDDPRFDESRVRKPDKAIEVNYPVFCARLALARLTNRYSKICAERSSNTDIFPQKIESLYLDINSLKDSIRQEWRPGNDIFADPELHQNILILHMEYHALLLAIFTVIPLSPVVRNGTFSTNMTCYKDQPVGRVTHSRRLLQTLSAIHQAKIYNPSLRLWYDPLLVAFWHRIDHSS